MQRFEDVFRLVEITSLRKLVFESRVRISISQGILRVLKMTTCLPILVFTTIQSFISPNTLTSINNHFYQFSQQQKTSLLHHEILNSHQVCLRSSGFHSNRHRRKSSNANFIQPVTNKPSVQRCWPRLLLEWYGWLCQPTRTIWYNSLCSKKLPGGFLRELGHQLRRRL